MVNGHFKKKRRQITKLNIIFTFPQRGQMDLRVPFSNMPPKNNFEIAFQFYEDLSKFSFKSDFLFYFYYLNLLEEVYCMTLQI